MLDSNTRWRRTQIAFSRESMLVVLLIIIMPGAGLSNPAIELDVDGLPGNGRDTVDVGLGDEIALDVWVYPDFRGLVGVGIHIQHDNDLFSFLQIQFFPPAGWTAYTSYIDSTNVYFGLGGDWDECLMQPMKIAALYYRAEGTSTCGDFNCGFGDGTECVWCSAFDCEWSFPSIIPTVCISSPTHSEDATWGRIKAMFH